MAASSGKEDRVATAESIVGDEAIAPAPISGSNSDVVVAVTALPNGFVGYRYLSEKQSL